MNKVPYNKVPTFNRIDIYYKIVLIGPRRVGKTQILKRICREDFNQNYSPSFGIDFRIQKYYSENLVIQIIELSDRPDISSDILKEYISDADCFICIYDITNINSVRELSNLVRYCENMIPFDNKKQCWYFVGNKCDDKNRECTNRPENLFEYVPSGNIGFIEISAKENKYVDIMFRNAITRIAELRKIKKNEKNDNNDKRKSNKNFNVDKNDENVNSSRKFFDNKNENSAKNENILDNEKKDNQGEILEDKKCQIY